MIAQSVCAVIVTYNPQPAFMDNIAELANQVDMILVVDNGSLPEMDQYFERVGTRPNCKVIRNHQNLGIAAALNIGVKYAADAGYDWVCTFDQDSRVSEEFVSKMVEAYRRYPHPERVAVLTPKYVDRESGVTVRLKRDGHGEILATMTSGSMIPLSVIAKLGSFDETLYIDAVDTEFCLRARRNKMLILQSDAILFHSLGRTKYHRICGLGFGATNHSAGRRYYITRNRLFLLMRYAADWSWAWQESRTIFFDAVKILLVEDHKLKKFGAMIAGTADALTGKAGKQIDL